MQRFSGNTGLPIILWGIYRGTYLDMFGDLLLLQGFIQAEYRGHPGVWIHNSCGIDCSFVPLRPPTPTFIYIIYMYKTIEKDMFLFVLVYQNHIFLTPCNSNMYMLLIHCNWFKGTTSELNTPWQEICDPVGPLNSSVMTSGCPLKVRIRTVGNRHFHYRCYIPAE